MTSIRALSNLLCTNCGQITLHASNVCQVTGCGQVNRDSGNPPVPREKRPYGYGAMPAKQYDDGARRRARAERHQVIRGVGTK